MSETPDGSYAVAEDLRRVLDIERLDRDLFRGIHAINAQLRLSLFGGQVAAQALMAAGLTVAAVESVQAAAPAVVEPAVINAAQAAILEAPVAQVRATVRAPLREYLRSEGSILKAIRETNDLDDATAEKLNAEIEKFKGMFNVAEAA